MRIPAPGQGALGPVGVPMPRQTRKSHRPHGHASEPLQRAALAPARARPLGTALQELLRLPLAGARVAQ